MKEKVLMFKANLKIHWKISVAMLICHKKKYHNRRKNKYNNYLTKTINLMKSINIMKLNKYQNHLNFSKLMLITSVYSQKLLIMAHNKYKNQCN